MCRVCRDYRCSTRESYLKKQLRVKSDEVPVAPYLGWGRPNNRSYTQRLYRPRLFAEARWDLRTKWMVGACPDSRDQFPRTFRVQIDWAIGHITTSAVCDGHGDVGTIDKGNIVVVFVSVAL